MRVTSVELTNFRQYRNLKLDLAPCPSDITIVVGSNGTGKTNFLNALVWTLYGSEEFEAKDMDKSPLVSEAALLDADEGQMLSATARIAVELNDGTTAQITREQDFVRRGNTATLQGKSQLTVLVNDDPQRGHRNVTHPDAWIEMTLPARLRPYFLFDGERLDNFFRHAEAKKVQDAVLEIAQIDLLKNLVEHLRTTHAELKNAAIKNSGGADAQMLVQRIEILRTAIDSALEEITEIDGRIEAHEKSVSRLESEIGNIPEVIKDIETYRRLNSELDNAGSHLEQAWSALYDWAATAFPGVLLYSAFENLLETTQSARDKLELPPPIDPQFLATLLEAETPLCVCGNDISDGSEGRSRIAQLLQDYDRIGRVGSALLKVEGYARETLGGLNQSTATYDALIRGVNEWDARVKSLTEDIKLLETRLVEHDEDKVRTLQTQLTGSRTALKRDVERLGAAKYGLSTKRTELERAEKELDHKVSKDKQVQTQMHATRFAKVCLEAAQAMYDDVTGRVRDTVSNALNENFGNMTWKKEGFGSVSIDDEYRVSVRNKKKREVLSDLSAGERECLALAFSLALSKVSGYELPIVIDTPLGRLDPLVQTYVTEVLADKMQGKQLIMLMTGTEYNERVRAVFEPRTPCVLEISFDQLESVSVVEKAS